MTNKVPPHSDEAERAVIGSMLLDQTAVPRALQILDTEDFYSTQNSTIFSAARDLFNRSSAVDLVTVAEHIKATGGGSSIVAYMAKILEDGFVPVNVEHYAKTVADKARRRRWIVALRESLAEAWEDQDTDTDEIISSGEGRLLAAGEARGTHTCRHVSEILSAAVESIELAMKRTDGGIRGISSGIESLDYYTSGWQASHLIMIAARTSVGKTTFGLNVMRHAADVCGKSVLVFSIEMSNHEIGIKTLCDQAQVSAWDAVHGRLRSADLPVVIDAAGKLAEMNYHIDDDPALTLTKIRSASRRVKQKCGLDLILVDYLQLIDGADGDNRQECIAAISKGLKAIAKEFNIPVISLSQLSRKADDRPGLPQLGDLRESGAIEQDSDIVIFLHREKTEQKDQRIADYKIAVSKNRHGPCGVIDATFDAGRGRFYARDKRY